jgi:hypothetical protein
VARKSGPKRPAKPAAAKRPRRPAAGKVAAPVKDAAVSETHLAALDRALHAEWALGRNVVLVWTPRDRGIDVIVIPHYGILDSHGAPEIGQTQGDPFAYFASDFSEGRPKGFIEDVISSSKLVAEDQFHHIAHVLGHKPVHIKLPFRPGTDVGLDAIEAVVKRYGISYIEDRAVALFDIVGFSLYSPLEQVTQLNSLSYSVNAAHGKMLKKKIDINFARTTTGDGFYVWNRDRSVQANINLYHFMHLVLADNAIARAKSRGNTTPKLRACFHVGGHYEFYQSEGLSPTIYSYIVGDVTIELARMVERAMPGQVLVGDFWVPMPDKDSGRLVKIDSVNFIGKTQATLSSLTGLELSGDAIDSIKCYLTGDRMANDRFGIKKYLIADKHGRTRSVYNAKINIYRHKAEPIFLGVQSKDLVGFKHVGADFVDAPAGEG